MILILELHDNARKGKTKTNKGNKLNGENEELAIMKLNNNYEMKTDNG